MNKSNLLKILVLASPSLCLNASEVEIPHSFTGGTAAVAEEVNENFSAVETAVDDNHQKIVTMQAEIDALNAENTNLKAEIEVLQNAQPSTVAMPVYPRGSGPNYADFRVNDNKGVFTVQFNVAMNPETFVEGVNVTTSGGGGAGSGGISWTDDYSTLIYTTVEDFLTIGPCSSGGLVELRILGTGDTAVQDAQGKVLDGDRDGLPGGDFRITYGYVC